MQTSSSLNETQLYEEYNQLSSFELCFHSQELVQDLVSKTSELVTSLRPLSYLLLYSDQTSYLQRKAKLEDILKTFEIIFQRLRLIGSLVHQRKLALNKQVEDIDNLGLTSNLEQLRAEKEQLIEQIRVKNRYIKKAIDRVADIIWQINSIQTLKQ